MLQTNRWYPMLQTPTHTSALGDYGSFTHISEGDVFILNATHKPDDLDEVDHVWTLVYLRENKTIRYAAPKPLSITRHFVRRTTHHTKDSVLLDHAFIALSDAERNVESLNKAHGRKHHYEIKTMTFTD